jgi:hypothetical protein
MAADAELPSLMVLDVESVGLHGEGFAWGGVLVRSGVVVGERLRWCHPDKAIGNLAGRTWVNENVLPSLLRATGVPNCETTREVRDEFWDWWQQRKPDILAVDVIWPVESNFLSACIADDSDAHYFAGPYPLWDLGTLRAAGLIGPADDFHDPLMDARASWLSLKGWVDKLPPRS